MSGRRRFWRVCFGLALGVTFAVSLLPASGSPPVVPHLDKLFHALAFAALAWLGLRAELGGLVVLLAGLLVFGAAIEVAQSFTATRQAEWADLAADGLGAFAVLWWVRRLRTGLRG